MEEPIRTRARVTGVVQGVGFRPFVYALATRLGLTGFVGNDVDGVFVEAEGPEARVRTFVRALQEEAPPLAQVETVRSTTVPATGEPGFSIRQSGAGGRATTLVAADSATCEDCLAELDDPGDRRHGYPFINCTNCGPRFTIVTGIPYDRPKTTMAGFRMCARCEAEYTDPADRRFHAQPVCCARCGPHLSLVDAHGSPLAGDPLEGAAALLAAGAVLAVKGLGGYHLAAGAADAHACATLRARKHREDKAFAVMVADLRQARRLCEVDAEAQELLCSRRRPIVLLPRKADAPVAPSVAPGNRDLGLMLPYTPMHALLLRATRQPVVLTSGNTSDEPIAHRDEDAFPRLAPLADAFLTHDRAIHTRTDDSVVRPPVVQGGAPVLIRRSRGYVPEPVQVPWLWPRPVLACGAELKNTFCLATHRRAFVSHHIGDLENLETLRSFTDGIAHLQSLFEIDPEVVAHDLHPEYLSTKHAHTLTRMTRVGVQHHHAHIAACLADNSTDEPVIGVALDGTGYGTDGTIWGGEFLLADLAGFTRAGFFDPVPMPGGAAAIRHPWRMAAAHLDHAFEGRVPEGLDLRRRRGTDWDTVVTMARRGVNAPLTSSAGRLFDAVSAIAGVRDSVNYEGQAAVELEQLVDPDEDGAYTARVDGGEQLRVRTTDLVRAVAEDVLAGADAGRVAARFHRGLCGAVVAACDVIARRSGRSTVALSGGVFVNTVLYAGVVRGLRARGLRVLTHARVPCNDGGISLGQAAVAGARDRARQLTGPAG
ncbi:carbamoyltransferase HypF [Nocardiopsis salina]|uniref:carbamoyltransferase HypF n=1 Tax=Nocardiopsis salina TaxID=245836 RepID=UPI00034C349D|nr:carbamoyltransferase HypF [Nocardiopsis salina]